MTAKIVLAKPEIRTSLDLSVSKVKTFKDCAAKFRFTYIERLPRKDWDHHIFGKFLHEILETFHKNILSGNNDPFHTLLTASFKSSLLNWKEKLNKEQKKEAWDICNQYLIKITEEKNKEILPEVISVERQFYIDIDGKILLQGFIDRVQLDPDGIIHVADYKTTKNKKYLKDYFQLLTYCFVLCLEDPGLQKVRASYILLRHGFESIVKEFSREQIMKVESSFLEYADKINNEKIYRPKTTNLCAYCDFLDVCPEGSKFVENIAKYGQKSW